MNLKKTIQEHSPRSVAEIFYRLAFKGFRLGLQASERGTHAQVWARNSYRLGNWIPFQSDIDLSVWLAREPQSKDMHRLRSVHSWFKKAFPILGEINLYVATDRARIEQLINRFELERDPQLATKLNWRSSIEARYHAAAFLLRMLESDIQRVLNEPEGRRKKWDFHVRKVTAVLGPMEQDIWAGFPQRTLLRGILDLICDIIDLPHEERGIFLEQMELYFQSVGRNVPVYILQPLLRDRPYLWSAFPHRFCFLSEGRPVLEGSLVELARCQLSWEVFGLLTQHRLWIRSEGEKAALRSHLEALRELHAVSVRKNSAHQELDQLLDRTLAEILISI